MLSNMVKVSGIITKEFTKINMVGKEMYSSYISVVRSSGVADTIMIVIDKNVLDFYSKYITKHVVITGTFCSYNTNTNTVLPKILMYIYVNDINFYQEHEDINEINISGVVCKEPVYRKTPKGFFITDLLVATHRASGHSDYIPCICWGKNAKLAKDIKIGGNIMINGRIQSRMYNKKFENETCIDITTYEVSVFDIYINEYV